MKFLASEVKKKERDDMDIYYMDLMRRQIVDAMSQRSSNKTTQFTIFSFVIHMASRNPTKRTCLCNLDISDHFLHSSCKMFVSVGMLGK